MILAASKVKEEKGNDDQKLSVPACGGPGAVMEQAQTRFLM